jgi:hypothetical protein
VIAFAFTQSTTVIRALATISAPSSLGSVFNLQGICSDLLATSLKRVLLLHSVFIYLNLGLSWKQAKGRKCMLLTLLLLFLF